MGVEFPGVSEKFPYPPADQTKDRRNRFMIHGFIFCTVEMKRANLWLLLFCLLFLAVLLMLATMERVVKRAGRGDSPAVKVVEPAAPAPGRVAVAAPVAGGEFSGHPEALSFGTAAIAPEREAEVLFGFLQAYRGEFGAFPTGNENAHFLNALAGSNPAGLVIFPLQHPRVSAAGELLDAWGRPFHFHSIDRQQLEVRSAGADGEFYTADDLIHPRPSRP